MSFLFPISNNLLDDSKNIIAILPNEYSNIAVLSRNTIIIRDSLTYSCEIISQFTRSPESIMKSGNNSWIQWFNQEIIFYGTSSGTIFKSNINSLSEYKELCISKVILSSFVCYDNLCLTTANSQIYFINSKCEVNYFVALFDIPRAIRHCSFHSPSVLSCIIDEQPYFITIDKNVIDSKYNPIPQEIPLQHIQLASLSLKRNFLAVSTADGDIILINVSSKRTPPIIAYKEERNQMKDFVMHMFWAFNDLFLVAIKESGKIIIWFNKSYEVTVKELQTAICYGYEHQTNRLYWSNMNQINYISFATIISHYAVTSSQIINLFQYQNKKYKLDTKGDVVFSNHDDFFPILLFASNENHFAVASLYKVSVDGKCKIDIESICISFFESFLVIFSIHPSEVKYFMNIYDITTENGDLHVKQIGTPISFPFKPMQISVFQNEMVVRDNKRICRIKMTTEKKSKSNENEQNSQKDNIHKTNENEKNSEKEENLESNEIGLNNDLLNIEVVVNEKETKYLSFYFETFPYQIDCVSIAKANNISIFAQNIEFIPPKGPFLSQDVDYVWNYNEGLPLIFILLKDTTMISCFMERVRVIDYPIMTDGYKVFSLKSKLKELGLFEFETKNVGSFFLAHLVDRVNDINDFSILNHFYKTRLTSEYPYFLADAIIKAFPIEKEMDIINSIDKKKVLIVAIALAVQKMPQEMKSAMLKHDEIDWHLIIPIFKGNLLYSCLMNISFKKFNHFCEQTKSMEQIKEPVEIIKRCIDDHNLIRSFLFAFGLNQVELFVQLVKDNLLSKNYSLHFCLDLMNNEKIKLADSENQVGTLKFFGSMMQGSELSLLSLATFVVINDKYKINSVILVDESIKNEILAYIENCADSQFASILKSSIF